MLKEIPLMNDGKQVDLPELIAAVVTRFDGPLITTAFEES